MPFQQPGECCIHQGLQIWTWNACAISFDDLDSLHVRLTEHFSWDIVMFQEGLKQTMPEHVRCEQYTLLRGKGEGRGAPMITLKPHLARKLTKWEATDHWVACLLGLSPPVIVFSLHCPQPQFSLDTYENVLDSLLAAMDRLSRGLRCTPLRLGGADLNCQLSPMADLVGDEGGGERSQDKERASLVYGFLCRANMRCSSSFFPFGPTRSDRSQQAVQSFTAHLDFLFASPSVRFAPHIGRDFPFKPISDHTPVVATVTAVGHSRAARRDLFRGSLVPPPKWDNTLPTAWLPDDPKKFRDTLRHQKPPPKLEDWPAFLLPMAREHTKWKEALAPGLLPKLWWHLRRTSDPLLRKAFQLHIRQLERDKRAQRHRSASEMGIWT